MTQLESAKAGKITDEMRAVAAAERLEPDEVRRRVAAGVAVIPKNVHHEFVPRGIGLGMRTKVNANIGHSGHHQSIEEEIEKLATAVEHGADSVMDLSTGDELDRTRETLLARAPVMLGTVPVYQVGAEKAFVHMTGDDLLTVIEKQARQGVDYVTVHCGVTRESVARIRESDRVCGIVSRGGAIHAAWIRRHGLENPLFERFDDLCEIAREHDVTLSLGDGLRPGAIADANDAGQTAELLVLGDLVRRARAAGVQAMVEGPGHVPLDQIVASVQMEKSVCDGAPFYVLGPLVTDVAPGYDHITGCVGGAIAAAAGVDMLCYITPAEHLRLPTAQDVRDGVIATRIAAHAGDIVKKVPGAAEWDRAMSERRKALDWEGMYRLAMDPQKARQMRIESEDYDREVCTMCGTLCSINIDNAGLEHLRSGAASDRRPATL